MAKGKPRFEPFYADDRAEWRAWLATNHAIAPGVQLIYYEKGSDKPCLSYDEVVEEALCFGWIDSRQKWIENGRCIRVFTPRKPGSHWSKLNKRQIESMKAAGLMTAAGLASVEAAKADGSWSRYDAAEALHIPDDLAIALMANETAKRHFQAFSPSSQKKILWWIESANRPETRQKRINETVTLAEKNIKVNHRRQ
jgi:uncharacterized protein YdeI (YjbR/CyaY-like superfamily)